MSKEELTVFLCTSKDCRKAWQRVCDRSPAKWLKHLVREAGLPYRLQIIETECMDRCEEAACLCAVHGHTAFWETHIRSPAQADRLLASLRACVETDEFVRSDLSS